MVKPSSSLRLNHISVQFILIVILVFQLSYTEFASGFAIPSVINSFLLGGEGGEKDVVNDNNRSTRRNGRSNEFKERYSYNYYENGSREISTIDNKTVIKNTKSESSVLANSLTSDIGEFNRSVRVTSTMSSSSSLPTTEGSRLQSTKSEEILSPTNIDPLLLTHPIHPERPKTLIYGILIQDVKKGVSYEDNVAVFLAGEPVTMLLTGSGFTNTTRVRFVQQGGLREQPCGDTQTSATATSSYRVSLLDGNRDTSAALITPTFHGFTTNKFQYICTKYSDDDHSYWIHQGTAAWLTIKTDERFLPFWVQAAFICCLLMMSGLFAGLTLGLLALDRTDLRILSSTGSEKEKKYAIIILPLRERGNYLLCSLVLGNVLVNSTLTILLDDLTSGLIAVIFSTAGIVIFGEIIPQAVCSRYGLEIGAKTIWITKTLMIITFPLSYTISFILDKILGEEIGFVYNREKLKELITVTSEHNNLEADEVNIISGALTMRKKTVADIMTPLENVYMLPLEVILDFDTLSQIRSKGYSRIPIYENERPNIVSILHTKDLIFVDPGDKTPLKNFAESRCFERFFILDDTTLDVVFKEFNETKRGHTAFVQRIIAEHDRDPMYETIGLITLEDVIEELIQYNRQIKD